jgi:hypothetical protein
MIAILRLDVSDHHRRILSTRWEKKRLATRSDIRGFAEALFFDAVDVIEADLDMQKERERIWAEEE